MKIKTLVAVAIVDSSTGKLMSIPHGGIAEISSEIGESLINDGIAEPYTMLDPSGTKTITKNGIVDVSEYALANVQIPEPSGTILITKNGISDVTEYDSADVNVPGPSGEISITSNGTADVTNYATANVNVPQPTGTISITSNGTVDVTEYATANVNVIDQNLVRLIGSRNTYPQYTITIPPGVQNISYFAFYQATTMVGVNIPDSVTLIDSCAFQSSGLMSIEIPDSVTTFGSGVFRNCGSLTSVEIPASVTNMGASTFYDCTHLTSVTMKATTPPDLGLDAFYNTHADLVIYVPAASVDTYKAASGWSTYASIIQAIS